LYPDFGTNKIEAMKIVTLNTWGTDGPYEKRWEVLIEELMRLNPEIICLQEAFDPELAENIQEAVGCPNVFMSLRSGLAILAKFELSNEKTLAYQTQSPTESYLREMISSVIKTEIGDLLVATTHLSWKSKDKFVRIEQVKELIATTKDGNAGIILAGDFNDVPESPAIEELKHSGFKDIYEMLHPNKNEHTWDNRNPFIQTHKVKFPDRRVDFLFFDEALLKKRKPKKCEIVFNRANSEGIYPSDHYGVFAELSF
jgi:endonuclease/exonuclease/phosphatase family metal-dependent hydrolase